MHIQFSITGILDFCATWTFISSIAHIFYLGHSNQKHIHQLSKEDQMLTKPVYIKGLYGCAFHPSYTGEIWL
jgi:hypothetical protein